MPHGTIGKIAKQAGVGVETIRYYERRGLLSRPSSLGRGWRQYGEDTLRRLHFIRRIKGRRFTLAEIKRLLGYADDAGKFCRAGQQMIERKVREIDDEIRSLTGARETLLTGLADCRCRTKKGETCTGWVELTGKQTEQRE